MTFVELVVSLHRERRPLVGPLSNRCVEILIIARHVRQRQVFEDFLGCRIDAVGGDDIAGKRIAYELGGVGGIRPRGQRIVNLLRPGREVPIPEGLSWHRQNTVRLGVREGVPVERKEEKGFVPGDWTTEGAAPLVLAMDRNSGVEVAGRVERFVAEVLVEAAAPLVRTRLQHIALHAAARISVFGRVARRRDRYLLHRVGRERDIAPITTDFLGDHGRAFQLNLFRAGLAAGNAVAEASRISSCPRYERHEAIGTPAAARRERQFSVRFRVQRRAGHACIGLQQRVSRHRDRL